MVLVLLVATSRKPAPESGQLASSCPAEIIPDEEVFHRRESCPLEKFYVSLFVLPFDFHD